MRTDHDKPSKRATEHDPSSRATRLDTGVQDFLDRYGRALTAGDGKAVAALWEVPALVIDDNGVIAVSAAAEVEAFFTTAAAQYRARGVVDTRAEIVRLEWATERIAIVDVRWPALDDRGHEVGDESATYTLRRDEAGALRLRAVVMRTTTDAAAARA